MIAREEAKDSLFRFVNNGLSMTRVSLEQAIDEIYDSIDEELEAREKNTARIRKRKDDLYEELGRYRQEYTKIKQKLDSIGTCGECKHSRKDVFLYCIYMSRSGDEPMEPDDYCNLFERKQC